MGFSMIRPRLGVPPHGSHADLDTLTRLQFKARGFSFLPRQPIHSVLAGRHSSRLRGRGLDFEELRRYLPGDDVRSIDWHVTARTGKPHVRVFTEERDRPVFLVVDQRQSMFFGSKRVMKSVAAAEAAALGAWRVLSAGDRVGALVFDDEGIDEFEPRRSPDQVMQILASIVRKNQRLSFPPARAARPEMFQLALERAERLAPHDALICLITDGAGADEHSVRTVTRLSEHDDVLLAFIYDPLEARLPDTGALVMGAQGLQLEVNSSDAGFRRRYEQDFAERLGRMRQLSRERQIPVLPISTAEGVAEQLRDQIGELQGASREE